MVSATDPMTVNLCFLDRTGYNIPYSVLVKGGIAYMERFIFENAESPYFNRQLFLRSQLVLQKAPSLSLIYKQQ